MVERKKGTADASLSAVCDGIGSLLIDQPVLYHPFFGMYFWRLGPGPSKIMFFDVFIIVFVFCLGSLFGPLVPCSR